MDKKPKSSAYLSIAVILGLIFFHCPKVYSQQIESLKFKHNWAIGFKYAYTSLFQASRLNTEDPVVDLSDYHKRFGLKTIYSLKKNLSLELGLGLLLIPKKKSIDSIFWTPGEGLGGIRGSGKGKGGAILPLTAGIRKTFLTGPFQPYIRCTPGIAFLKIGSGTASGSIGDINKEVDIRSELALYVETGVGLQLRSGKSTYFDFGFNGFATPDFSSPIGSCSSYSGWNISVGINFLLNSRK